MFVIWHATGKFDSWLSYCAVFHSHIWVESIGGDPGGGGGGTCPPLDFFFPGGIVPPSIFESLKNIYSYICI